MSDAPMTPAGFGSPPASRAVATYPAGGPDIEIGDDRPAFVPPGAVAEAQTSIEMAHAGFLAAVADELDLVEAALKRLDASTAGRCELCGAEMDRAELVAAPLSSVCSRHQGS